MKRYLKITYVVTLVLLLASCKTVKIADSKTIMVENAIYQYPTVAELDIAKSRASGTLTIKKPWYAKSISNSTLEFMKGNVVAQVINAENADVLLEPKFLIDRTKGKSARYFDITVTGYPATYKNFHSATKDDLEALKSVKQVANITQVQVYQPKVVTKNTIWSRIRNSMVGNKSNH